ncbi:MAG: diacylglycerol kinase [Sphingobacteriales bacterium]|nr:MAG: diacylglycerol kinase [Sphingobacteriales bacterium]
MKVARVLHNPKAGEGKYDKKALINLIESKGYKCVYASVKEDGWDDFGDEDFIVVAGGDGTVRKLVAKLLKRKMLDKRHPIAILPMGTANNIGRALNLLGDTEQLVESWSNWNVRKYDVCKISGLEERDSFFIEGVGFGLFPNLISEMKKHDDEGRNPEHSLKLALELIQDIARDYKARECKLEIDGIDHSGKFLLVEIMNTPSIGPNLSFNPFGDPSDGELEIVLIPENQREKFIEYMNDRKNGIEAPFCFSALKGKDIKISWDGIHAHVDDKLIKEKPGIQISLSLHPGILQFLQPGEVIS